MRAFFLECVATRHRVPAHGAAAAAHAVQLLAGATPAEQAACLHHALKVLGLACMAQFHSGRSGRMAFSSGEHAPCACHAGPAACSGQPACWRNASWLPATCGRWPQAPQRTLERVVLSSQEDPCVVDQAGHAHARQLVGQRLQRGAPRSIQLLPAPCSSPAPYYAPPTCTAFGSARSQVRVSTPLAPADLALSAV